jgi:formylglycine-generating enzyme required for sulfatase activity
MALGFLVMITCGKDRSPLDAGKPGKSGSGETGTVEFQVQFAPWKPLAAKSTASQKIDRATVYACDADENEIATLNLEMAEGMARGKLVVPAQKKLRVVLGFFDGETVRYLGEDTVDVPARGSVTAKITEQYLGTTILAPDSAYAGKEYRLSWMKRPYAESYEVQESLDADFSDSWGIYSGKDTTCVVEGKGEDEAGSTFYYRARAYTEYGYGPWHGQGKTGIAGESGTVIIEAPIPEDVPGVKTTGAISGKVLESGAGLSGVSVRLTGGGIDKTATTGSAGSYILNGIPNGTYTLTPSKSGYTISPSSRNVTVSGGDIAAPDFSAVKIAIGPVFSVTGRIFMRGSGLRGLSIRLAGAGKDTTAITDTYGYYTFTGVPNGSYNLSPLKSEYYVFAPADTTIVVNGAPVTIPDIIANFPSGYTSYSITGFVREAGAGLPGVAVRITGASRDTTLTTNYAGYYIITGIPGGTYTITPTLSGYIINPQSQTMTVEGNLTVPDFTATSTATSFTVAGRIVEYGLSGGLSGVSVRIAGSLYVDKTATTSSTGEYVFSDIPNGFYTVTPSKTGFTFRPANVEVTVSGAKVTVPSILAIRNIFFASIPGGTFQMGNVENDSNGDANEKPVHSVTLSGFEMSAYEITQIQYAKYLNDAMATGDISVSTSGSPNIVTGAKGTYSGQVYLYFLETSSNCHIKYENGTFTVESGYEIIPVVAVTWYGAKAFAKYYGYDLPTEAEWEYACRGGRQYKYGTDDGTISSTKAYYNSGIAHSLQPVYVGSYPANPFLLYDMCGNVWEWCHDWFGSYPSGNVTNPTGPQTGTLRVSRGGSYGDPDSYCRAAYREQTSIIPPGGHYNFVGFRVVRRPGSAAY